MPRIWNQVKEETNLYELGFCKLDLKDILGTRKLKMQEKSIIKELDCGI